MTDANAQSKVLVVPIHIAVLRSGGGNIGALGARADFSKLPYCEQEQAVQTCPFTSDLALEETKKQPTPGVHLHWTLPEAFRTLRKQPEEEGRASQPEGEEEAVTLPNRWRVTRTIHGPKGSRSQSWIIESNRLNRKDPRLNVWPATVTVPVHPDDAFATSEENTVDESYLGCEQSHRYLGQVFDAVTWTEQQEEMAVIDPGNPENNKEYLFQMLPPSLGRSVRRRYPLRSRRLTPKTELHKRTTPYDLTIVGYGDLDFTSFYPNCSSVFGFCDPADQLAVSGYDCTQDKLSYSVTGWYCEDEKDPLQKLNFSFFQSTVLQLNGNGKVECPAHGNPTEAISVSLWVKSASETWNSSSDLLCKRDAFILHPEKNSKKIQFKVSLPKGWKTVAFTPDDSFDLKQWHQYAATYDGKVLILSIDGEECARTEGAGAITNANSELSIGHDPVHGGDDGFKGLLAHVCLWQKALSAAEIQAFHERPPTSEEADLLAYFPLNQFATGSTVTNLGGKEVPHVCPDGTVINGSIVTSNSLPVTCSTKDDADAYQAYQDSGLKLGEQETGCYNSEFEWFFPSPSKVKPVASLYHGIVEAFDFDVTQVYDIPTQISQGKHDIVIGNNTAEAYSALLTVRLENTISENTLNALQSNLLPTLNKVGGAIAVDRQLHAARFRPAVEGKTWQLTGIRTDDNLDRLDKQSQANTTLPKLTSELIALVNELNEAELSIQQVELQLAGTQQQLMADWRKFLYFQYTKSFPVGSPPYHWLNEQNTQGSGDPRAPILNYLDSVLYGFEVEIVRLRQVQNDQANKISRLQRAIRSILEETDAVLQTPRGVVFRGKLSAYYELTPGSTIPATYYQANEPCVLLAGPGLETPINYQHCPDRRDGFLECDVDLPNNLPASSPFLPDRFAAVSAATFAGRQAGAVLASTLQALEKRACLVANNDRSFTVPSPKITVTKKGEIENCWLPLMLAWEAKVRPLKVATLPQNELHYEADTLLTRFNWNDEVMDLKENKDLLNKQKQTLVVKNRLQLSAGVTASLQDQINILLEKLDDPQSQDAIALKDLKSKLSQTKLMSQVMAGFSQGLLMRAQTMQLAVWDPVAGTTTDWDRVVKMQDAIGDQNSLGEVSSGSFSPLRGGIMQLAIQVIDCFGRNLLLQQSDEHGSPQSGFIVAQSLTPADLDVALTRYINLPPRLVAPAHLHFNWICAQSLKRYINSHDVNPILGWILYNYLENSLDIYDAKGKTIGSIFVVERDGRLVLLSQGQPGSTNWPDLAPINNKILAAVVDMLSRQTPAYLHAFFTMLNDATQLTPSEVNNATNVSVLLGKPLALVSAYLKLECNGHAFPLSQGWTELKAAATTSPPLNMLAARNAQALHEVQFPMRLGHENSVDDGLIGFFKHMPNREIDTARFYSQSASDAEVASTATIVQPKIDDLVLSIDPQHCELVTLLIDPFKPVHLTSGVLPIQSLTVSKEHLDAALENMKSTFLLTPVICPPGFIDLPSPTEVVRKLPMPTPSVSLSNGQWSWLQPEGRSADASLTWDTYEPTNSSCEVGVNFSPQTIHEGWLVLSHSRQTLVLEDQPTPSDQMLLPEPVLPPEVFPEVNAGDEPPLETRF